MAASGIRVMHCSCFLLIVQGHGFPFRHFAGQGRHEDDSRSPRREGAEGIGQTWCFQGASPGMLPLGAGFPAGGSGMQPEHGQRAPAGPAAGDGSESPCRAGPAPAEPGSAPADASRGSCSGTGACWPKHRMRAAEPALEGTALAEAADEGGRGPQGAGDDASRMEGGSAERGSAGSGFGHGQGRLGNEDIGAQVTAAAETLGIEEAAGNALSEALSADRPP